MTMKFLRLAALFLLFLGFAGLSPAQDQATPYYNAGNTYYGQKNYDMAIRYYQAAVQFNPNMWQAYQGMGNSYYAKGDKANALTNYQKSLSINPNNPQLSQFVQVLQPQVGTAPPPAANPAASTTAPASTTPQKAASVPKTFEIAPMIGVGLAGAYAQPATLSQPATTVGGFMGIGGGMEGYYLLDKNFGIGLVLDYFIYDQTTSQPVTGLNASSQLTYGTGSSTKELDLLEFMPSVKYTFDGNSIRPYVVGSIGFCFASSSSSANFSNWSNGQAVGAFFQNGSNPGASYSGPMAQIGVGGEYSMGEAMNLFLQAKYNMVLAGDTTYKNNNYLGFTFSSIPIEAGMNFDF